MKIYTKKGDAGETGLYGGDRVSKDHLRIRAYGTLDELNAYLGVVISSAEAKPESKSKSNLDPALASLTRIQSELFQLGAELATPRGKTVSMALLGESETLALETEIDSMEAKLPPLKSFILPGGVATSARLHMARTISRRAERELITLHRAEPIRAEVLQYINRLSDYLFVCARFANFQANTPDVAWVTPKI